MGWFGLALFATFIDSFLVYGDKYLIEREMRNPYAMLLFFICVSMFFSLILWGVSGFGLVARGDAILLMFAGAAPAYAGLFYFQAISREETSHVILLMQMTPLFALILAAIFRDEQLSQSQMIGFVLILIAVIGVSMQKTAKAKLDTKPDYTVLMLSFLASFILAAGVVLADDLVERLVVDWRSLTTMIAIGGFGQFLGGVLLYLFVPRMRHAFHRHLQLMRWQGVFGFMGVEASFLAQRFIFYMALGLGSVSLIMVVSSLSIFFVILIGWFLTLWQPLIFKEDISRETLVGKAGWAALAFVGILLIR